MKLNYGSRNCIKTIILNKLSFAYYMAIMMLEGQVIQNGNVGKIRVYPVTGPQMINVKEKMNV